MATLASTAVELARWQFALTTLFHFIFVPLTLGLAPLLAVMQTLWHRTGDEKWLRLTRFFGTLFLINFAIGVATGLVMEFQFGMNWSAFSAYVGDVFGPPLAIEGIGAFMLEATFIGLWVFGWNRLSPKVHLATIYLVWLGTWLSAYFILTANSWMQHPVGYELNSQTGRAEATDIFEILFQGFVLFAWTHAILAGLVTGELPRARRCLLAPPARPERRRLPQRGEAGDRRRAARHVRPARGRERVRRRRHRRAADEDRRHRGALGHRAAGRRSRSSRSAASPRTTRRRRSTSRSRACSRSSRRTRSRARWSGSTSSSASAEQQYGPGNYIPDVRLVYWSMRVMAYLGTLLFLLAAWGGWLLWRRKLESAKWFQRAALVAIALPFLANFAGWILTEAGRQPWVVYGLLKTEDAVSSSVSAWTVGLSLGVFVSLYAVLGARRLLPDAPLRPPRSSRGRTATRRGRRSRRRRTEMTLEILWFCLLAFFWTAYFVLEGFDFGVGMLLPVLGRSEGDRRTMFESIGPLWDGNEVWLVIAGGATFAAFPVWYATMFSGFYLALLAHPRRS